jgi:hypothetical protein
MIGEIIQILVAILLLAFLICVILPTIKYRKTHAEILADLFNEIVREENKPGNRKDNLKLYADG